uniref:Uncharacterized protein n=1 Tax=Panagrolaimus davidi TaxID=227884 RepID=A0A914R5K3_9BILA
MGSRISKQSSILNHEFDCKDSMMVFPNRRQFFATCQQQEFNLPDSIMHYIAKNSKGAQLYQKKIQMCKYFFIKNPIIILDDSSYKDGKWNVLNYDHASFDINKFICEFWINGEFCVIRENLWSNKVNQNIVSSIIPKLYRCDIIELTLFDQLLSFDALPLLLSGAERIKFFNVQIKNGNGSNVAIEKIVEIASKAKEIHVQVLNINLHDPFIKFILAVIQQLQ